MSVGIAVIGAGMMGMDHATRIDEELKGAHLAVLSDVDSERATAGLATLSGTGRYIADGVEAINDPSVDAVLIAAPDAFHVELTLAALRAGKPVLCEKPLAPSAVEACEVLELESSLVAAGSAARVSLGFMRRFDPGCVAMRETVDSGAMGNPLLVHCVHRNAWAYPGGSEHTINASAVHVFDFLPWLLGSPITSVTWMAGRSTRHTARRDPQVIVLENADAVLITLEMFVAAQYGYEVRCEVVAEDGTSELRDLSPTLTRRSGVRGTGVPEDSRLKYADAYRAELNAWIASIKHPSARPEDFGLASAWDGYTAALVAESVIESMRAGGGQRVTVSYSSPPLIYRVPTEMVAS